MSWASSGSEVVVFSEGLIELCVVSGESHAHPWRRKEEQQVETVSSMSHKRVLPRYPACCDEEPEPATRTAQSSACEMGRVLLTVLA